MESWWNFLVCALAVAILIVVFPDSSWTQEMMGGRGGMMGDKGMREMMQQMMGNMLPPPMDPAFLPDPDLV